MRRIIKVISVISILLPLLTGCGVSQGANHKQSDVTSVMPVGKQGSIPKSRTAQQMTTVILNLSVTRQWTKLYSYLVPSIQKKYSMKTFADDRGKNGAFWSKVKKYKISTPTRLKTWTFKHGNGKTYKNVTEVPFQLVMNSGKTHRERLYLMKINKKWKLFWWTGETAI